MVIFHEFYPFLVSSQNIFDTKNMVLHKIGVKDLFLQLCTIG